MIGTIKIVWNDDAGTLRDEHGKVLAGPGDSLYVDHLAAERFVEREKRAHYPARK